MAVAVDTASNLGSSTSKSTTCETKPEVLFQVTLGALAQVYNISAKMEEKMALKNIP